MCGPPHIALGRLALGRHYLFYLWGQALLKIGLHAKGSVPSDCLGHIPEAGHRFSDLFITNEFDLFFETGYLFSTGRYHAGGGCLLLWFNSGRLANRELDIGEIGDP